MGLCLCLDLMVSQPANLDSLVVLCHWNHNIQAKESNVMVSLLFSELSIKRPGLLYHIYELVHLLDQSQPMLPADILTFSGLRGHHLGASSCIVSHKLCYD